MKKLLCVVWLLAAVSVSQALIVTVTPAGDGASGKDRWGYSSWESSGFITGGSPNEAYHWYETPDGSWRDVYMQISLTSLPSADSVTNATLYINILSTGGDGCGLYHAADASAANGNASQKIGAGELVTNITSGSGWTGIDVTDFIKNDLANGYQYAAFKFAYKGYSSVKFSSGESAEFAPYLSVVPEPATMTLLALGGLLLRKRK